jgi:creatinine amidohydrolase
MKILLAESDWIAVRRCAERDGVAVLPLGSLEQHGPHLPLGTDTFQITRVMQLALDLLPDSADVCVLPPLEYTVVQWASPLASVGVSPETHTRVLVDIAAALHDVGFRKIVFVHGHGGLTTGRSAQWQAMYERRPALYVDLEPYTAAEAEITKLATEHGGGIDGHAGAAETSMMLAVRPDLVRVTGVKPGPASLFGDDFPFRALHGAGVYTIPVLESAPDGYDGDPNRASTDAGRRILDALARTVVAVLADLAKTPTPPEFKRIWRRATPSRTPARRHRRKS